MVLFAFWVREKVSFFSQKIRESKRIIFLGMRMNPIDRVRLVCFVGEEMEAISKPP